MHKELGKRIKLVRIARDIKIVELAERSGVDKDRLSRIERGQAAARLEVLEAIAPVLGVTVAEMVAENFSVTP